MATTQAVAAPPVGVALVNTAELMQWLGYERAGDVERWLRTNHVPYWRARHNQPVTTVAALNATLLDNGRLEPLRFKDE